MAMRKSRTVAVEALRPRREGIAETTVKTHLNQTYHETGVNHPADLVKLVAARRCWGNNGHCRPG